MKKKKSNNTNKNESTPLSKKHLLRSEYEQYKLMGEVDRSQNWLECFTPTVISDLFTIMNSCSDNQQKADYILEELSYWGFRTVGLGTNIYTLENPAYPGVVFKIALDDNGICDNCNDEILRELVNGWLEENGMRPRYTEVLARHPSGMVTVQERKVVISDQDRMDTFRASILKTLRVLAQRFLIVDLAPSLYHLNYGIDRDGKWCFIDASDLFPLSNMDKVAACDRAVGWNDKKHKVIRCGGRLRYTDNFTAVICEKCGAERLPLEIRPKPDQEKEEKIKMAMHHDGSTSELREKMRLEEMARIRGILGIPEADPDDQVDAYDSTDDDMEEVVIPDRKAATVSEEAPTPSRLPTREQPVTIFVDPKVPKPEPVAEEPDADEDADGIEADSLVEPTTAPMSFSDYLGQKDHTEPEKDPSDTDEEEEVEKEPQIKRDILLVDAFPKDSSDEDVEKEPAPDLDEADPDDIAREMTDEDEGPADEEEESSDEDEEDSDFDHEPEIRYEIIPVPEDDTEDSPVIPGIYLTVRGDFDEAFAMSGLGLYIRFKDDNTISQLMSATSMEKLLRRAIEDHERDRAPQYDKYEDYEMDEPSRIPMRNRSKERGIDRSR